MALTFLSKHPVLKEIRSYLIITLGMLLYSFAYITILTSAKVIGGGMAGIGTLVFFFTGGEGHGIPIGHTYFVANLILLAIGSLIIGPKFGIKTIYAILFSSISLSLMQKYIPLDFMGLQDDKLLSAILGGAVCGLGVGICFSQGGSTGGTDIIAMIVNKYRNISLGKVIILCDVIIVGSSYFVFKDVQAIVYGFITLTVVGYSIDLFLQGMQQSTQIFIFSSHHEEIADRILKEINRGVTLLDATGWYSKQPQKVVLVVCRRTESAQVYRIIKECDNKAFISASLVSGVYGQGFDVLRVKNKKT